MYFVDRWSYYINEIFVIWIINALCTKEWFLGETHVDLRDLGQSLNTLAKEKKMLRSLLSNIVLQRNKDFPTHIDLMNLYIPLFLL